jgi:hypothetical protein
MLRWFERIENLLHPKCNLVKYDVYLAIYLQRPFTYDVCCPFHHDQIETPLCYSPFADSNALQMLAIAPQ